MQLYVIIIQYRKRYRIKVAAIINDIIQVSPFLSNFIFVINYGEMFLLSSNNAWEFLNRLLFKLVCLEICKSVCLFMLHICSSRHGKYYTHIHLYQLIQLYNLQLINCYQVTTYNFTTYQLYNKLYANSIPHMNINSPYYGIFYCVRD